jgi:hypothetical protein
MDIAERVTAIDWKRISTELDAEGSAVIEELISSTECAALAALYPDEKRFRSRIVMSRHRFGRGEYKYFSYPLPDLIAKLRAALYPHLAVVANRWNSAMGVDVRFPGTPPSSGAATRRASAGRRRCCCSTAPMTTTACIRISTASMSSRCR